MLPHSRCRAGSANGRRAYHTNRVTLLMKPGALLALGSCLLDTTRRSLTRVGEEVSIGERDLAFLTLITSQPGEVIPSDVLIDRA